VRLEVGRFHARLGRWREAAADYAAALRLRPDAEDDAWFEHACLCLLTDDREGYRAACVAMLKRCQRGKLRPFLAARACAQAADSAADPKEPGDWPRRS
jgi:hypothetical protein